MMGRCADCKRIGSKAGYEWLHMGPQLAGGPVHLAKKVKETTIRMCLHTWTMATACGKTFNLEIDSGD